MKKSKKLYIPLILILIIIVIVVIIVKNRLDKKFQDDNVDISLEELADLGQTDETAEDNIANPEIIPSEDNTTINPLQDEEHIDEKSALPDVIVSEDFMMGIEDIFSITGRGTVVTGKILSGHVSVGAEVEIVGFADEPQDTTVGGIEIFRELIDTAISGDNVGILLDDIERSDVERGQVLAAKGYISAHNTFSADLTFIDAQPEGFFEDGNITALCYFRTTDSMAQLYFDKEGPDEIGILPTQAKMISKMPMKEGTTFVVRQSGKDIATGTVTAVDIDINLDTNLDTEGAYITLIDPGDNKIKVIQEIRGITGLGLAEAKKLIDETPSIVKKDISLEEAEDIKEKLENLGATVQID